MDSVLQNAAILAAGTERQYQRERGDYRFFHIFHVLVFVAVKACIFYHFWPPLSISGAPRTARSAGGFYFEYPYGVGRERKDAALRRGEILLCPQIAHRGLAFVR